MSQSPTETPDAAWMADEGTEYRKRWARLNSLVEAGNSWSGNERNCFFLNRGDGKFVDVSGASGFDFSGDGRGLALCDWDGDGDLDMWMSNRTAPRLQFLENRNPAADHRSVIVRLHGDGFGTNRDAIGARVTLILGGSEQAPAPMIRTVRAGDGYLSQGAKELHFGIGRDLTISRVEVRWKAGVTEGVSGIDGPGRYEIVQGKGTAERIADRRIDLPVGPAGLTKATPVRRLVLSERLPMPAISYPDADGRTQQLTQLRGGPVLLNLWAPWCAPCVAELGEFAKRAEAIRGEALQVVALSVEEPERSRGVLANLRFPFRSGNAGRRLVELVHLFYHHAYAKPNDLPVPTSFLIDKEGRLAAVYLGAVGVDELLEDVAALSSDGGLVPPELRGTWAVKPPAVALGELAYDLFFRGFPAEGAAFVLEHKARFNPGSEGYTKMIGKAATELLKLGDHAAAVPLFEEVVGLEPDDLMSRNNLAWILATSADDSLRDGAAAVRHAEHASRLTGFRHPAVLETLAAAYAEAGQFAEAIKTADAATGHARQQGNAKLVSSLTTAREHYAAGRALRIR